MAGEVDGEADAHDDDDGLEDVELPAEQDEEGDGVGDAEADGDDGEQRDEHVARGEQQDEEGDAHGEDERAVGAGDQLVLQVVEGEADGDEPAGAEAGGPGAHGGGGELLHGLVVVGDDVVGEEGAVGVDAQQDACNRRAENE